MKKIYTDKAPKAVGPYSQGISFENLVFSSGQIPINPESGEIELGSIEKQAALAINNLKQVLLAAGSDLDKVLKTTCFLTDMDDFAAFNAVYATFFTSCPARSCVEVSALPKGVKVEIEAIAIK